MPQVANAHEDGSRQLGSQSGACTCCGAPAARLVPLVEPDMSVRSHKLCGACWDRLLESLARQRPWLHIDDDPDALYLTSELAWSLLGHNPVAPGASG